MRRLLLTLIWSSALTGATLQLYGRFGVVAPIVLTSYWVTLHRYSNAWVRAIGVALPLLWAFWLVPSIERELESSRETWCQNLLRQCVLTLGNYEAAHHRYPPARIGGRSWHVAVFPYFCAPVPNYRFEEAWDSPHNWQKVSSVKQDWFRCPQMQSDEPFTTYLAVVDERTIWPPDRQLRSDEITDDPSTTLAILEAPDHETYWAKPEDLSFDEAVTLLTTRPSDAAIVHSQRDGVFSRPVPVINVAFADTKTRSLRLPLKRETAVALLTRAGGEAIDPEHIDDDVTAEFDSQRAASLGAFLLLAMTPAFCRRSWVVSPPANGAQED
jgi:hypothetical protein